MMEIGKIIKEERTKKNLTQEELANDFFVSRQLISKWENGKSYPDLEQLVKLSDFFNLSLDDMLRGDKKMTAKLNVNIKRKTFLSLLTASVALIAIFVSYFFWTQQPIQLTPDDLEVVSISSNKVAEKNVFHSDTRKEQIIPEDVTYTIQLKNKKKFTKIHSPEVFGTIDSNDPSIYLQIQAFPNLFSFNQEETLTIPAASASLYQDATIDHSIDYSFSNKDKSIRILNIEKFSTNQPQKDVSWLFIDKKELKNK